MIRFDPLDPEFVLHDLDEVTRMLKTSRLKVEQHVRSGALAAVHHGGRWMVCDEEIQRFRQAYRPPERTPLAPAHPRRFIPPRPDVSRETAPTPL